MGEKSSPTKFQGEKNAKKYWEETNTNQPPRDLSLLEMSWTSKKKMSTPKKQPTTNQPHSPGSPGIVGRLGLGH